MVVSEANCQPSRRPLKESWYRIEYHRIVRGVVGPLVWAEQANNHGFCVSEGKNATERAENWLRYCAEDWLAGGEAEAGRWAGVLWRLDDNQQPLHELARLEFRRQLSTNLSGSGSATA